jgi:hypothetical protein
MRALLSLAIASLVAAAGCGADSPTIGSPVTPTTPSNTVVWGQTQTVTSGANVFIAFNSATVGTRDDQETLHLVWQEGTVARHGRLVNGSTTWTMQSLPTVGGGSAVYKPTIAFVDASLMFAAWMDQTNQGRRVLVSRSVNRGQTWDTPLVLAQGGFDSPVSLVGLRRSNGTAGAVVAWSDTIQNAALRMAWRGGSWATSDWTSSASLASGAGTSHDVALGARGDAVIAAWEDSRSGQLEIFTTRSLDGGLTWGADARLSLAGGAPARGGDPSVAIAANGAVVIAWQNASQIYGARSTTGGQSFGDVKPLGPGLFAHVAVGDGDDVAVAWEHFANASMLDDAAKTIGLSISLDGLATIDGPHAMPASDAAFHRVQSAVIATGKRIDVVWIDLSPGARTLMWRGATLPP